MNTDRPTLRTLPRFFVLVIMIGVAGIPYNVEGQEFNCSVSVNDRYISGSSYNYVAELGPELERYINENRWTDDRYEPHERIRCRIQIVLTDVDEMFNYDAEVILNMRRPVYNSMQESAAVVLSDDNWVFNYPRDRNLIRDDRQFDSLTSFIDFYMYVLLGFDYDSFAELGGSDYFRQALDIFEVAQMDNAPGWGRSIGSQRNRYGLINDLTNPSYEDLRRSSYQYHRLGLDQFTIDVQAARNEVIEAIGRIGENRERADRNYLFDIFFDTKYTELVSIFQGAPAQNRLQAYNLFRQVDPSHSSAYERLRN